MKIFYLTVTLVLLGFSGLTLPAYAADDASDNAPFALTVYKSPTCGCCGKWVEHLEANEFSINSVNRDDMASIKQQAGIGSQYQSCHTGFSSQGYIFEGHVPARYIEAFLSQPPENAVGLAVPAMPVGSPGMEMGDRFQPYQVMLLIKDGSAQVFAQVNSPADQ